MYAYKIVGNTAVKTYIGDNSPDGWYQSETPIDWTKYIWSGDGPVLKPTESQPEEYTPTLEELKDLKWIEIKAERDRREMGGFAYMGKIFDSDSISVTRIAIAGQAAQLAIVQGTSLSEDWTCADNTVITLDEWGIAGMAAAIAVHSGSLYDTARMLRGQIASAQSAQEVEAIRWPD